MILSKSHSDKDIKDLIEKNKDDVISIEYDNGVLVKIKTNNKEIINKLKQKGFS